MDRKQRRLFGIGIAAFVLILLIVLVVVIFIRPRRHHCIPMTSKPELDELEVINVASEKDLVVANMAGYLELLDANGNYTYMPLDINSVSIGGPDAGGVRAITLYGECLRFEVRYYISGDAKNRYYTFTQLGMLVANDAEQDKSAREICKFDYDFEFKLFSSVRYSCKNDLSHKCSKDGKLVATLRLKSFELELDGAPNHVKERVFSKDAWFDSCQNWIG